MSRAVLDTNVVISALVFRGAANVLVEAWQRRRLVLLVSNALLSEYIRVLRYPKFRLTEGAIRYLVERELVPFITPVKVSRVPRIIRADPSDNQVLACAVAGRAQVIVTGDRHLLALETYRNIPIVPLSAFLERIPQ